MTSVAFQLVHHVPDIPNAGDAVNAELWPRLLGLEFAGSSPDALFGIGSILTAHADRFRRKFVVGTGARGFGDLPRSPGWRFFAVRGPLTAAALGLDARLAIADPGVLVPEVLGVVRGRPSHRVGLVSYFRTEKKLADTLAEDVGVLPISMRDPAGTVLARIAECEMVLTESLHGAIFADALRVPWVALGGTNSVAEGATAAFKWQDWCSAMRLDFSPVPIQSMGMRRDSGPLAWLKDRVKLYRNRRLVRRLLSDARPSLSAPTILAERQERLREAALRARAAMLEVTPG